MARKRVVKVQVERLQERYNGELTGKWVFRTLAVSVREGERVIKRGSPLGRGYTVEESLCDFCRRANLDDPTLGLLITELEPVASLEF